MRALAFLAVIVLTVGCIRPLADIPLGEVSGALLSCEAPCDLALSLGAHNTAEPHVAANPTDPLNFVAAAADYDTATGDAWMGIWWTADGGETWSETELPGKAGTGVPTALTPYTTLGDAVVAFDKSGNAYVAGIAFDRAGVAAPNSAVFVARSEDKGKTWPQVALVAVGDGAAGVFHDKEWITTDPATGEVYMVWSAFLAGNNAVQILFSKSVDAGASWSTPTPLTRLPGSLAHQGAVPAVTTNGTLAVAWVDFEVNKLVVVTSTDKGATFTPPAAVADVVGLPREGLPPTRFRHATLPAMVAGASGDLVIAWNDLANGDADILAVRSTDDGATWSAPLRVNQDALANKRDQFMPALAAGPDGAIHVGYYDRRDDVENRLMHQYVTTLVAGVPKGPDVRVSALPSDGDRGGGSRMGAMISPDGRFMGDYNGIAASSAGVIAVWPDTRNAQEGQVNSDLYAAVLR